MNRRSGPAVTVLGALAGCVWCIGCDRAPALPDAVVRDSAGVEIIESDARRAAEVDAWTVSEDPVVEIGARDGPEEYQLSLISNVWRTADGRIVVADRMSNVIRLYDGAGDFLTAVGGQGDGPGEFRTLTWAGAYVADSIVAWDGAARRMTVFDGSGRLGRTFPVLLPPNEAHGQGLQSLIGGARINGALADGSLVFTAAVQLYFTPGERRADPRTLVRYSETGELLGSIGMFPGPEIAAPSGGPPLVSTPFPRPFLVAAYDDNLYVGASSQFEIQVLAPDGTLRRSIRLPNENLVLSEAHRRAWRADQFRVRTAAGQDATTLERALEAVAFPETRPPYIQLVVAAEGYVWARSHPVTSDEATSVWRIFDPRGVLVSSVQTPGNLEVYQVWGEGVLGVSRDEFEVPYVRLHALSPP